MSIKIFDADCAINLFERMKSYDCTPFLSSYDVVFTKEVFDELRVGNSFKNNSYKIHSLSSEEMTLRSELSQYITTLEKGEISVIVHALHMSNVCDCEGVNKIIVLSNDKEARHVFYNIICKDPALSEGFPRIHRIIWSRSVDFIRKLWDEGCIDTDESTKIYNELYAIIGPELNFLKG